MSEIGKNGHFGNFSGSVPESKLVYDILLTLLVQK